MSYRRVRCVHFWITMVGGLPLLLLGLSGALLVFGPEMDALLDPSLYRVTPTGRPLGVAAILDRLAEQMPEARAWSLAFGLDADESWTVWLAKNAGAVHLDPYTGTVLGHRPPHASFSGLVTAFHRWWLTEGEARSIVRHALSAVALAMMVQVLVGIWLWSIPPRPWKRLALRFSGRVGLMRLHQLSGLLTGLVLMMVAFTGMSLHWHEPTKAVVEWLTGDDIVDASEPAANGLAPIRDLDLAIALGRTVLPDVNLRHIRMPREPGDPVLLAFGATRQSVPTRVWVGDDPPRVIAVDDGRRASTGQWLWHLRYLLHVGDFAGPVVRALWVIVALLPVAFVATGVMLHFGRRRRRSRPGRHFSKNDSGATSSA